MERRLQLLYTQKEQDRRSCRDLMCLEAVRRRSVRCCIANDAGLHALISDLIHSAPNRILISCGLFLTGSHNIREAKLNVNRCDPMSNRPECGISRRRDLPGILHCLHQSLVDRHSAVDDSVPFKQRSQGLTNHCRLGFQRYNACYLHSSWLPCRWCHFKNQATWSRTSRVNNRGITSPWLSVPAFKQTTSARSASGR